MKHVLFKGNVLGDVYLLFVSFGRNEVTVRILQTVSIKKKAFGIQHKALKNEEAIIYKYSVTRFLTIGVFDSAT
jgi:hypothetical protein